MLNKAELTPSQESDHKCRSSSRGELAVGGSWWLGKRHDKAFRKLFHSLHTPHFFLQQWQLHNVEILRKKNPCKTFHRLRECYLIQVGYLVEVLGLNPDPG